MTTTENNVFQSKWGFHAIDRETFLKIKRLKKEYYKAQRQAATWFRWARKLPKNRKGQNEPSVSPVFCSFVPTSSSKNWNPLDNHKKHYIDEMSNYEYIIPATYRVNTVTKEFKGKPYTYTSVDPIGFNNPTTVVVKHLGILAAYEMARHPKKTAEEVVPLKISKEEIEQLFSMLRN